jgi:peptidoglycan DL-endopeptidase CwlO
MTTLRRRIAFTMAMLAAVAAPLGAPTHPAAAGLGTVAPAAAGLGAVAVVPQAAPNAPGPGNEGENTLIRDVLAQSGREYAKAKAKLDASKKRQLELDLQLRRAQERLADLSSEVGAVAAESYRTGRLGPMSVLLNSISPDSFLQRAQAMELITVRDDRQLRDLNAARAAAAEAKAAIDTEAREQEKQLAIIAKQKQDAERALAQAGGESTRGFVSLTSPVASQAPRNADGSWPSQSCSVNDPTTSGCITPRTLHALQEAKKAGFTRFVSCYRPGGPYEHPKGRACDFSAERNGFGGVAQGGDRTYGNNLAAFFVRNSSKLGVLYVIWFKQIWFPATGWRAYHSGNGDPSSDHTNHVHLSLL